MRKIIGIGETLLDIIFENNLPKTAVPGGSVFNGLVSLGRLGMPVEFVSEVGNDKVGEIVRCFMEENNISTKHVNVFPEGKSAVSLAFLDNQNNAEYIFYKDYPKQRLDVEFPIINENDILVFGSFYALNPDLHDKVQDLLDYAKKQKAIIYYDPNFRVSHANESIKLSTTIFENIEHSTIVRGSDEDFKYMFNLEDTDKIYNQKIKFECPNLIVTRGSNGIDLRTPSLSKHYDIEVISPKSTIGAGDSFNAGVIYGLMQLNITQSDAQNLPEKTWDQIINYGVEFSKDVCSNYENYISKEFVAQLSRESAQ